ncbi:protein preY, mitochondrial [Protopterus annectens]|uniref:protein preY, mitochondrial n=1 Tax=Protopterus annectens TaxID=7888 RepID=UPI001CF9B602|nr:protein preY, mitochondrial [Protopterus annectens]
MLQIVYGRLGLAGLRMVNAGCLKSLSITRKQFHLSGCTASDKSEPAAFDSTLLDYLVCPLSKKPLRYDESNNELINEELGIAYPILNGIPNLIPQDARKIRRSDDKTKEEKNE